jgi:hypothetical protein
MLSSVFGFAFGLAFSITLDTKNRTSNMQKIFYEARPHA